jgi:sugar lactone lactonase YvrE
LGANKQTSSNKNRHIFLSFHYFFRSRDRAHNTFSLTMSDVPLSRDEFNRLLDAREERYSLPAQLKRERTEHTNKVKRLRSDCESLDTVTAATQPTFDTLARVVDEYDNPYYTARVFRYHAVELPALQQANQYRPRALAAFTIESRNPESWLNVLPVLGPLQMIEAYVRRGTFSAGVLSTEPGKLQQRIGRCGKALGEFCRAVGVRQLPNGDLAVSDYLNHRVQVFSAPRYTSKNTRLLGGPKLTRPFGLAVDFDGNIVVGQCGEPRVRVVTPVGVLVRTLEIAAASGVKPLEWPTHVAVAPDGQYVVADSGNQLVRLFDASGAFVRNFARHGTANGQMTWPSGVCVTGDDDVFIADAYWCCVHQLRLDGTFVRCIGSKGNGDGQFLEPSEIAVDAHNNILVSDPSMNRLQMLRNDGAFVRTVFNAGRPTGVCVMDDGRIAVCDDGNDCVDILT